MIGALPNSPSNQECQKKKFKERGLCGYIPTLDQEMGGHFKMHRTTTVDVERPRMQKSRGIKRVLKAFQANEPKIPFSGVPEGLDSGNLRAEDLFPQPRTISSPYEEDKEFIDGLLFFAPESEDAIRSMLGHPTRRPPPSSERP